MRASDVGVSVIIPTTGRASLSAAIRSVRNQRTDASVEIVVVFDAPRGSRLDHLRPGIAEADTVLYTGGGRRGGYARNLGVEHSSYSWVAYLDDDDQWKPDKLQQQLDYAIPMGLAGKRPVVGSRVTPVYQGSGRRGAPIPVSTISGSEGISSYLFVRRRPGSGRASFFTSTMLLDRELALEVPWTVDLVRHQDWDLLVRLGGHPDVVFHQVPVALVDYTVGSPGSISAGNDWRSSLEWAERTIAPQSKRVFSEFIVAQTMRYALQARDWTGVGCVFDALRRAAVVPSVQSTLVGLSGIMSRERLEQLMAKVR